MGIRIDITVTVGPEYRKGLRLIKGGRTEEQITKKMAVEEIPDRQ